MSQCFCHFNGYEVKDSKARPFNSVAKMKENNNIVAGNILKTIGYYEANDGGGATYLVREKTDSDIIDNGSLQTISDNLVAELVIDECVNVKQFGAVGDGTTDDTNAIQTAINYIRNRVLENSISVNNSLVFPGGNYKITSTLELSPFVKLKTTGFTTLHSYVSNGACIHITHKDEDLNVSYEGDKQDWFRGPIINGENGLLIVYKGPDNSKAIGIKIGSDTNLSEYLPISRFSLNDVRFCNFNIATLFNHYNNYIATFNRISFETNNIGVQYGSVVANIVNSGEKIYYNDCLFANTNIAVNWLTDGFDSFFVGTSFDYNKCIFYDGNNKGHRFISVSNCHIESTGDDEKVVPYGIVYGVMQYSTIVIESTSIQTTKFMEMFITPTLSGASFELVLHNNKLIYTATKENYIDFPYLCNENVRVLSAENNHVAHGSRGNFIAKSNMIINPNIFDSLNVGVIDISSTNKIGKWDILEHNNINLATGFEIVDDSTVGKYLKLIPTTVGQYTKINMKSDFIPVLANKNIILNYTGFNSNGYPITLEYYDKDRTLISTSDSYHNAPLRTEDTWIQPVYIKRLKTPQETAFIKIQILTTFHTTTSYEGIGKVLCQYE